MKVAQSTGTHLALLEGLASEIRPDDVSLADWCSSYLSAHRARFLDDLALADRHLPMGSSVLDVGSIPPIMVAAMQRTGRAVVGIDIDPSRFQGTIADLGLDVRTCDIERQALPFGDETFDAVTFNEVFEHLRINPLSTMREVARVLKVGGKLLLCTPNLRSYRGIINLIRHHHAWSVNADPVTQYQKLETMGHMGHVREYTAVEIASVLRHVGLEPAEFEYRRALRSSWKERAIAGLRPNLLPYVSVIAVKQG